jgi:hypothetical protein
MWSARVMSPARGRRGRRGGIRAPVRARGRPRGRAVPGQVSGRRWDGESRLLRSVTSMDDARRRAWHGSWHGLRVIPVQRVLSVRFSVASVLSVRSVHGAVFMVRRRSTVQFRNGAPGRDSFSKAWMTSVARAERDARRLSWLSWHCEGPAGVTEGSRRRSFQGGPDHRRPSLDGHPFNPRDRGSTEVSASECAREDFKDRRVDVASLARAGRNKSCRFTDGCLESEKRRWRPWDC